MSHIKHHTKAIVLGGVDTGEADRFIWALTGDFGMVGFHARSARKISSKQRSFLDDLSHVRLSLVRGRNMWRLTNVEEAENLRSENCRTEAAKKRIALLLSRLIRGEEKHSELFETVLRGFQFLNRQNPETERISLLEKLVSVRILFLLGYVEKDKRLRDLLEDPKSYDDSHIHLVSNRREAISEITSKALEASGL